MLHCGAPRQAFFGFGVFLIPRSGGWLQFDDKLGPTWIILVHRKAAIGPIGGPKGTGEPKNGAKATSYQKEKIELSFGCLVAGQLPDCLGQCSVL